jgi:hypothetical protein
MDRRAASQLVLFAVAAALVCGPGAAPAVADEAECAVKYVSAEHVYLDAGSTAGLVAGQPARVVRGADTIAVLEVVFVADHSATATVVESAGEVRAGDIVIFAAAEVAPPPTAPAAPDTVTPRVRVRPVPVRAARPVADPGPRLSGYLAVQWDHTDESADRDLATDFVSMPFRARVTDMAGGLELRARGSLRHITRTGYTSSTPADEWRNRVQEVSLVRDDRRQDLHLALGRITTRFAASAGPFDGGSIDHRVAGDLRLGAFGGFTPDWGDLAFSTDNKLAGAYANYNRLLGGGGYLDVSLAGVGRYEQGEISREYVTLVTSWRDGARWSLLQAAEVDINRGWRRDEAGLDAVALTSIALTGRCQVSRDLRLDLGYDDREPVRTWETRATPDSLFQSASRTGWRAGAHWRTPGRGSLGVWGTLRERPGDAQATTSWNVRWYQPRLTAADLDLSLSLRGFDGPYLSGWSPVASVARRLRTGGRVALEGGYYGYDDADGLDARSNTWVAVSADRDLTARLSLAAEYRRDFGDDMAGNRWFLELRRRF